MKDRLHKLNEAARCDHQEDHDDNDDTSTSSSSDAWLPLESNPEILNTFAKSVGLRSDHFFVDYYGPGSINNEEYCVKAFLLLFPCTERIYDFRRRQESELLQLQVLRAAKSKSSTDDESDDNRHDHDDHDHDHDHLCFIRQIEAFGNACGTIGCLHACLNTDGAIVSANDGDDDNNTTVVVPVPALQNFVRQGRGKTPKERGELLLQTQAFKSVSDTAAVSSDAQTVCPPRDGPDLDHHFVAFCLVGSSKPTTTTTTREDEESTSSSSTSDGQQEAVVWELDGTKSAPVNHGTSSPKTFEEDVWRVVQSDFIQVEPDSIEFSLIALVVDHATTNSNSNSNTI